MKTKILLFMLLVSVGISAQNPYYYYKGEKVELTLNRSRLNIIVDDDFSQTTKKQLQALNMEIDNVGSDQKFLKLKFKTASNNDEYAEKVNELKQIPNIKHILPYFERQGAEPIGISDIFYVKLKNSADTILLQKVALQKNVQVLKQVQYMPLWYILSLQTSEKGNTLDAANFFYETGMFEDIDPAFMFNFRTSCTNDPLFGQLWGLKNNSNPSIDIKACDAWTLSLGAGIKVAVVDQGIDATHNDLSANISSLSFDAQSGTSPSIFISGNKHGTHVAGTVAAVRNNNLQVVGVAPEAKIMRISHDLYISATISSELASGISWAWHNGADVITNSWGDQGGRLYNDLHSTILESAIINAMAQGRNGKGCVVTFAAGNYAGVMDYPASFHNDILTVGAISSNGNRASFSGYGTQLDVVAPGVKILSTIPNNGTSNMDGTSMAAPHVAGVAALVLSVNPNLTGQQVRNTIESTAQRVRAGTGSGYYNYQTTSGRPNGTWNNEMGYGLVNAYAAVLAVCSASNFTNQTVTANTTVTGCNINVQNVTVQGNAKLTLDAANNTTINGPFEVKLGSELEIK